MYFKAWDERDHNSIVLRQAESAGVDFVGYKVLDRAILEKLERDLREFGIKTERIAALGRCWKPASECASNCPPGICSSSMPRRTVSATDWDQLNPPRWGSTFAFEVRSRGVASSLGDMALGRGSLPMEANLRKTGLWFPHASR